MTALGPVPAVTAALLALCAATHAHSAEATATAPPGPQVMEVDGVRYHVLRARPESIRIVWTDDDARALRTFAAAEKFLREQGEVPLTLMNGGIFEPGGVPSGLLVQSGRELRPVNRKTGTGNFYLLPNGIFLIGERGAAVIATEEYPAAIADRGRILQAVQSGPLLLRSGRVHPKFNPQSTWRLHRNGVGIADDGTIVFAMTDFRSPKFPNLHEFAELFRRLGCANALFLDGDLSQMRSGEEMRKPGNAFGSIIAVVDDRSQADASERLEDDPKEPPAIGAPESGPGPHTTDDGRDR